MQADTLLLAGVLGLDVSDPTHAVMIADVTRNMDDLRGFIEYCRAYLSSISYATATQRLDILATRYKREEAIKRNADKFGRGEDFILDLVRMVEETRNIIKNERAAGRDAHFRHMHRGGERVFSDKQLRALASVGSTEYVIERSETGKLYDDLMESLVRNILSPAPKHLPQPQQRVMSFVSAVAERMEE